MVVSLHNGMQVFHQKSGNFLSSLFKKQNEIKTRMKEKFYKETKETLLIYSYFGLFYSIKLYFFRETSFYWPQLSINGYRLKE